VEAPVFEDREAGVAGEQAPSRTEIAGEPARPGAAPPGPKSSTKPAATPAAKPAARASAPKAEPEAGEAPPASPKAGAGFYVQVISTTSKPEATRWKEKLSSKKYKPALSAVDSSKGKMYRIRLGPYSDKEQARKLAAKISAEFHRAAWVAPAQ
jgi:cell division septation protein DedD